MAYNYNKVDRAKLLKVGFEGFAMLEGEYPVAAGAKRQQKTTTKKVANPPPVSKAANCIYQYQPQPTLVMNPVSSTEEMINSYDGRLNALDYSRRKSAGVAY